MFELTGATSDLNLLVGYPDLETVHQGGRWFWPSEARGVLDRIVIVEPALAACVNPGPYYIEVSPEDFRTSSPFTLGVRIQQPAGHRHLPAATGGGLVWETPNPPQSQPTTDPAG